MSLTTALSVFGINKKRERRLPLPSPGARSKKRLREETLFLKLLAVDAERRPGDGLQALLADDVAAVRADAVRLVAHAVEGFVDEHEEIALAVGEGEVQFLGVGAGSLVGEVLDAVVGLRVARGLVALVGVVELFLLLAERILVLLKGVRLRLHLGHDRERLSLLV